MDIRDFIPTGKENAISRQKLIAITGWDDRTVRNEIKRAVKEGVPILSSSHCKGYWISEDLDEWEQYIRETDNRRRSLYYNTLNLRKEFYKRKGIRATIVKEHIRRINNADNVSQ